MPPMPASVGQTGPGGVRGPSTFDKLKMGAMMGGSVGLIMGFIIGSVTIIKNGPGPNGMMRTLGQYMLGSGATFGFFMSIGSVIRTESSFNTEAFAQLRQPPMIMPRQYPRRLGRREN